MFQICRAQQRTICFKSPRIEFSNISFVHSTNYVGKPFLQIRSKLKSNLDCVIQRCSRKTVGVHWVKIYVFYSVGVSLKRSNTLPVILPPVPELYQVIVGRREHKRISGMHIQRRDITIMSFDACNFFLCMVIVYIDHPIAIASDNPFLSRNEFSRVNCICNTIILYISLFVMEC